MGKTTFVDGDPSQDILGTIITAAMMNALNNHRHSGKDEDGAGVLDYASDSGSANAYAITLSPALSANITGMPIRFKAANTNTGTSTLNVNGIGTVAIKKNVSTALAAGDIVSGQIVTVVYDGTNFQLMNNGQSVDLSQFGKNLASNGYQKLPNGLIIQWGSGTGGTTISGATYSLPVAFPNGFFTGVACDSGGGVLIGGFGCTSLSTYTLFSMDRGGTYTAGTLHWMAVGY